MTRLKEILNERRISQLKLSRSVEISQSVINQLVNGRVYPYPGYRRKISAYLNMPEWEIFPEIQDKTEKRDS